jgi:hypothetical protein
MHFLQNRLPGTSRTCPADVNVVAGTMAQVRVVFVFVSLSHQSWWRLNLGSCRVFIFSSYVIVTIKRRTGTNCQDVDRIRQSNMDNMDHIYLTRYVVHVDC